MERSLYLLKCRGCGCHIFSSFCPICGKETVIDDSGINTPVVNGAELVPEVAVPMFLFFACFAEIFAFGVMARHTSAALFALSVPFLLGAIAFAACALRRLCIHHAVRRHGRDATGVVIGYEDSAVSHGSHPLQRVLILASDGEEEVVLSCQLGTSAQPFRLSQKVDVRLYGGTGYLKTHVQVRKTGSCVCTACGLQANAGYCPDCGARVALHEKSLHNDPAPYRCGVFWLLGGCAAVAAGLSVYRTSMLELLLAAMFLTVAALMLFFSWMAFRQ